MPGPPIKHQENGVKRKHGHWDLSKERRIFRDEGHDLQEIRSMWVPCGTKKSPFRTEWLAPSMSVGASHSYQLSLGIVLGQGEPNCFAPIAPLPRDNTHLEVWALLPVWDSERPSQVQNSPWACWGLCSDHTASLIFP